MTEEEEGERKEGVRGKKDEKRGFQGRTRDERAKE